MKAALAPYVDGMDLPPHAIWVPLSAADTVKLLGLYKAGQTRPWHTDSFWVYDLVGTGTCYVAHTWLPSEKDLAELKEFLHI